MKKTPLIVLLTILLSLFILTTQALAGPTYQGQGPSKTPGPPVVPGAQATAHAALRGKRLNFQGTIAAVSADSLTLTLRDGSSQTFALTAATIIRIPGPRDSGATLQVGMKAMVRAVSDQSNNLTTLAVLAIPGKPVRAHRVGWVTAYTAGASITIQASDGNLYTYTLTADTKILPAERASLLAVGSRVTIIAPRVPSSLSLTANGIVVHPAGSGAGSQPAATPAP